MKPPRALVTGAAGFIGSHVCQQLLDDGFEVVGLDDLSGGYRDHVPAGVAFVEGSINNQPLVARLFEEHAFDGVWHLAAYAAEGLSHFIRGFNYTNNLLGSVNLINASVNHGIKLFVFTSSIAVYGRNQLPMHEDLVPAPEDPYGVAKYAVELDLRAAHEMFGLNYVVFRPHNVYGEHQNLGDPYRNVIGIFMNQIMQDKPLTMFGDGTQTRAFSYISDVVPSLTRVWNKSAAWNQVYNVGADTPYEVRTLAEVVGREFGVEPKLQFLPERKEVKHAYCSHDKVRAAFPELAAPVALEAGIRRMAAWARKAGSRTGERFGNIEIPINLPPSWAAMTGK